MPGPTGILLLNMGGPRDLDEVQDFLTQVMTDEDIIKLPFQRYLGPLIARTQVRSWKEKYERIGGCSPLLEWTRRQAAAMAEILDRERPESAPHLPVPCFRYSAPDTAAALAELAGHGVREVVALTQYPQYSCTTTGASLHELWDVVAAGGWRGRFRFSLIDRFGSHPSYVDALASTVLAGLEQFPVADRDSVVIVYNAHTLPRSVINRNDAYLQEITATVGLVQDRLEPDNPFVLAFGEAGRRDQGPGADAVIHDLAAQGHDQVLVVGVAFTSDHEETLYETDVELAEHAREAGIRVFRRAPALNDRPEYARAMADVVTAHLDLGRRSSPQLGVRCIGCTDTRCGAVPDPAANPDATRADEGAVL